MVRRTARVLIAALAMWNIPTMAQEPAPNADKSEASIVEAYAIAILRKADDATRAVQSVRYTGVYEGPIRPADMTLRVEGPAVLARTFRPGFDKFRFTVEVRRGSTGDPSQFTAGGDTEWYYLVDWQNKRVHADTDPSVIGTDGQTAQAIGMIEFVHDAPFRDEINGARVELKTGEIVDKEPCHVVHVVYSGGIGQEATWFISKNDNLPRRVIRKFHRGDKILTTTLSIAGLVVDPELPENEFGVTVPEGFDETDDWAPNRTMPR